MKRALILVDLQNDFFPGGSLAVREGDKVLKAVNALLDLPFDLIIATKDYHPPLHVSFASTHGKHIGEVINNNDTPQILWIEHCVQGSKGSDFAPGWDASKVNRIIYKGTNIGVDSYSTFFDNGHMQETGLDAYLKEQGIDTIYIA
ncbi:MAG: isochorismatase family protein, partial [Parachlamydiaceae bacterium]